MSPTASATLDPLDKQLLTLIQQAVPLEAQPYHRLAERLTGTADDILARIERLKAAHVIRQISAIFDTRVLGYKSTLVAMKVAPDRVDQAAAVVNSHPGVSHNYKRNHLYNLWFTIAMPSSDSIEDTVTILHEHSGAISTIILPTLRLYKIGVKLDLTGQAAKEESAEEIYNEKKRDAAKRLPLQPDDIAAIRILQEDLPLVERPFAQWAQADGWTEESLLAKAQDLKQRGVMRRFAGILHHREAGFKANAMVVWDVSATDVDRVGQQMARQREVSHCYRRPTFPDWPYSLFTMIHAPTYSACMDVVNRIVDVAGDFPRQNLFSTKEYKKIRLKYFTEELDAWWERSGQYLPPASATANVCSVPVTGLS